MKAHHDDITADMKSKIKRLNRRETVNTIDALLELYFEIRERSMDDFQQDSGGRAIRTQDVEREKTKLLAECNNDILVVLDHLRANIRIQFAFKEDYEEC